MPMTRRAVLIGAAAAIAASGQNPAPDRYPVVPYVPTPPEVVEAMLQLANVHPGDTVYDLGSGDGRIVITAAQKFGASAVGVEIDPDLVSESRQRAERAGLRGKAKFLEGDLFETDIRPATVVTLYLIPKVLEQLKPKLLAELKPGSRVVAFAFPLPDWTPSKTGDVNSRRIYLWVIPERPK